MHSLLDSAPGFVEGAIKQNVRIKKNLHGLFKVLFNEIGETRVGIEFFSLRIFKCAAPLSHKTHGGILKILGYCGARFFCLGQSHLQFPVSYFYEKLRAFLNGKSGHAVEGKAKGGRAHLKFTLLSLPAPRNS